MKSHNGKCLHTRTVGYGVKRKLETFFIDTKLWEVSVPKKETINGHDQIVRDKEGKILYNLEVGEICPRCYRIYETL